MTLESAYRECERITSRHGPNFSVGFAFLPEAKRRAVHAAYAFCRLADDIADEVDHGRPSRLLERWRGELHHVYAGSPRHSVGVALADAVRRFPIAQRSFEDLIRGCAQDLRFEQPVNLSALRRYCDLVATPIGEISLAIFGTTGPGTLGLARHLSHALQWTNILRDVAEDFGRGRVYLPREWFGFRAPSDLSEVQWRHPIDRGIDVASSHFEAAGPLSDRVEADCVLALRLMQGVYREILDRIAAEPARVLRGRVALDESEKRALVEREMPARHGRAGA